MRGAEQDPYQNEWDDLMTAIRNDQPYSEVKYGVEASLVTSMGRMAAHTGQEITYDDILVSSQGNASALARVQLTTLDVVAPVVRLSLPAVVQGVARGEKMQVTVVATDAVGVGQIGVDVTGAFATTQKQIINPVQPVASAVFTVSVPVTVTAGGIFTLTGTAADAAGNVKYPNVNSLIEMTDMREAQRSYEANINVIGATRRMIQKTIEILKA